MLFLIIPAFSLVSILFYRCTTWSLTKHMEKKLDGKHKNATKLY